MIPFAKVDIHWVGDYYNGPLSGVGLCNGKRVYFFCEDEIHDERIYGLYDLTAEQWAYEDQKQADFIALVGDFWDYRPGSKRQYHHSAATEAQFYMLYPPDAQHDLTLATRIETASDLLDPLTPSK